MTGRNTCIIRIFGPVARACPRNFQLCHGLFLCCPATLIRTARSPEAQRAGARDKQKESFDSVAALRGNWRTHRDDVPHLDALKIAAGRNEPVVQITCQIWNETVAHFMMLPLSLPGVNSPSQLEQRRGLHLCEPHGDPNDSLTQKRIRATPSANDAAQDAPLSRCRRSFQNSATSS